MAGVIKEGMLILEMNSDGTQYSKLMRVIMVAKKQAAQPKKRSIERWLAFFINQAKSQKAANKAEDRAKKNIPVVVSISAPSLSCQSFYTVFSDFFKQDYRFILVFIV